MASRRPPAGKSHVVVIGGGLAGLAASFALTRAGRRVTVLEAAPEFGGLASSVRLEGIPVERFYHFILARDRHLLQMVEALGLGQRLHWRQARTAFYIDGRPYPFCTPWDLLRFSPIPFRDRLRCGVHALRASYRTEWRSLDAIPARTWLIRNIGEEAYRTIWHPLLQVKFGDAHDQVSAAWIWHRIWRVSQSRRRPWQSETFGYLEHGSALLIDALVERLAARPNCTLRTGAPVEPIELNGGRVTEVRVGDEKIECDAVLSTVPLPLLDRLVPGQEHPYFETARGVRFLGIVCALFSLKRPFSTSFWTNVNDPRISFNGIIEQTNLNRSLRDAGLNLIYIPFYLPTADGRYAARDEDLFAEYTGMLQLINPEFDRSWVKEWRIFRARHAQAICVTNFLRSMPGHRSPVDGLYVTDSTQFYPQDRTLSAAIEQGTRAAEMILEDLP